VTWAKHAACANIGQRNARRVVFEKLKGRHQLRHLTMEGMMITTKRHLKGTGFNEEDWSEVAGLLL
jgi:hypothetical protein